MLTPIVQLISNARVLRGSDVHLVRGLPPRVRIDGTLTDLPGADPLTAADCEALLACGYDSLRHREVLTADFADVTQLDISLEGEDYTLTAQGEGEDRTWAYQDEEQDITTLQSALEALVADSFTDEQPSAKRRSP